MNFGSVEYVHTRFVAKRPRDPVQLAKQVFDIAIAKLRTLLANQSTIHHVGLAD